MTTRTIQIVRDISTGELGMLLKGVKLIDTPMVSFEGQVIAHDIIEHQNGLSKIGGFWDEFEAIGVLWWNRGQFDDYSRKFPNYGGLSPVKRNGFNIQELISGFVSRNLHIPDIHTRPTDYDDDFMESIEYAKQLFWNEYGHYIDDESESRPVGLQQDINRFCETGFHFMRRGYRKALRRFHDSYNSNRMFWGIADAVDKCVKEYFKANKGYRDTVYTWQEGQEMRLTYTSAWAECKPVEV